MAEKYLVPLDTPCVYHDESFLPTDEANDLYGRLHRETQWQKTAKINRWVALHQQEMEHEEEAEEQKQQQQHQYQYRDAPAAPASNNRNTTLGYTETICLLQQRAQEWYVRNFGTSETAAGTAPQPPSFNVCLLNFYETGQDRIGWHADREEIGRTTPIASISLGATRQFLIRSKTNGVSDRTSLSLQNGSMVWMENRCQHDYLHSVPRETTVQEGRINVTFRCCDSEQPTDGEEEHVRRDTWLETIVGETAVDSAGWAEQEEGMTSPSAVVFGDGVTVGTTQDDITKTPHFLIKTNLGAESYCAAEVMEQVIVASRPMQWRVVARPMGILDGYVALFYSSEDIPLSQEVSQEAIRLLLNLKSAHYVLEYHHHFDLANNAIFPQGAPQVDGDALYQYFKTRLEDQSVRIPTLLPQEKKRHHSFRVTCERIGGPHAFRAPNVEYEIGGAIVEYYAGCTPKMEDYDVNIRADVVGNIVVVGTQLNVHDLSKERHFLRFRNAVTIKTNLAYAMVRCANLQPGDCVADPFCGSGTLLLEAMEIYNKKLTCIGIDVSRRSADGARENAIAEGFDSIQFHCSDARGLRRFLPDNSVNAMVTNLPWGIMTGQNTSDLPTMYEVFLRNAWYSLRDGGRIVMLVLRGLQVMRIVRKLSGRYRLLRVNVVRTTNNLPCILVVEKLEIDSVRESIKGQLAYLNQYVNVSPELYQAIHTEDMDGES